MWVLLVSVYMLQPVQGQTQSQGIIQAPMNTYDECLAQRDHIRDTWRMQGYRVSARCLRIPQR